MQMKSDSLQRYSYDVAFVGNLCSPNNVEGVRWVIKKVIPLIRAQIPGLKFLIAGSTPVVEIVVLCASESDICLIADPISVSDIYHNTRVMVNPVLRGSGVNVKAIELLLSSNQVVTTPQGVAGLPERIVRHFYVETDPERFAFKVVECLRLNARSEVERQSVIEELSLFDIDLGGKVFFEMLEECVARFKEKRLGDNNL